jgi:hypothetical protein
MGVDFRWENLKEGYHLSDISVDGKIILKWVVSKWDWGGGVLTGVMWRVIENTGGGGI